jgi:hypothetical protein
VIEAKEIQKKRGLHSPDCADTLCLTFAVDVAPQEEQNARREPPRRSPSHWMGV